MEKNYQPQQIEATCYQTWEAAGYFQPTGQGQPYCIMIPPPNVTGTLHMGHGFQHSLMDALIRYHRMQGHNTLWQAGTDHAGIATQMVVERQLQQQGQTRHDLGRDAFVDKVWQWKAQSGNKITEQIRRMGNSVDWSSEKFTMDPALSRAVHKVFIDLYQQGLIYRGKRLVNWDPVLHTAVSDLEVISEEAQGSLWHIRFPLAEGEDSLIIATTRPETLLGDSAVAVHPDDSRYQQHIGKQINHPLTGRQIPIIADSEVDPSFGTGCVKITPAHDFNDYAMGQRHQLAIINILTDDAKLNDNVPADYQGLDRFVARKKIVQALDDLGLLVAVEAHTHMLPKGDRSGTVIEPYLTDQWFVRTAELAEPAIAAVKQGDIRFHPDNWKNTYLHWLENIEDWCISRQLWWGHRIPAWYDKKGNVYVGDNEASVRQAHALAEDTVLTQDNDVLDTWFSSALWPFATLGWPEQTEALHTFYPTNVLVTGFDIIFFWVARMVMMGLKFTDQIPFRDIYITGLIRDGQGHKMSKSKGNVIDPIDLIDGISLDDLLAKRTQHLMQPEMAQRIAKQTKKEFPQGIAAHGTDALRFTFCALASTGRDIRFDMGRLAGYRNFCNKLWNATRYVRMQTEGLTLTDSSATNSLASRWIQHQLQLTIQQAHQAFVSYRFDLLAQQLYEFTWQCYCDWYLELAKVDLAHADADQKIATANTLINVLETLLRLLHPIIPFITESLWQSLTQAEGKQASIMVQAYPQYDANQLDNAAVAAMTWVQQIITTVRTLRAEMRIAPNQQLRLFLRKGAAQDRAYLAAHHAYLSTLAKLTEIDWLSDEEAPPHNAATGVVNHLELFIPLDGLVDLARERQRLDKEIAKLSKQRAGMQQRLTNAGYLAKAPAEVVKKEQEKFAALDIALEKLSAQKEKIT